MWCPPDRFWWSAPPPPRPPRRTPGWPPTWTARCMPCAGAPDEVPVHGTDPGLSGDAESVARAAVSLLSLVLELRLRVLPSPRHRARPVADLSTIGALPPVESRWRRRSTAGSGPAASVVSGAG